MNMRIDENRFKDMKQEVAQSLLETHVKENATRKRPNVDELEKAVAKLKKKKKPKLKKRSALHKILEKKPELFIQTVSRDDIDKLERERFNAQDPHKFSDRIYCGLSDLTHFYTNILSPPEV